MHVVQGLCRVCAGCWRLAGGSALSCARVVCDCELRATLGCGEPTPKRSAAVQLVRYMYGHDSCRCRRARSCIAVWFELRAARVCALFVARLHTLLAHQTYTSDKGKTAPHAAPGTATGPRELVSFFLSVYCTTAYLRTSQIAYACHGPWRLAQGEVVRVGRRSGEAAVDTSLNSESSSELWDARPLTSTSACPL